jgi:hypothetical protein
MTGRVGDRGWRVPSALTAVLAALLLLLSPAGHAWAGGGGNTVAQSQAAHHDEAVITSTASRAAGVGSHATDLSMPARHSLGDPSATAGPTVPALRLVTEASLDAASARAPPLKV